MLKVGLAITYYLFVVVNCRVDGAKLTLTPVKKTEDGPRERGTATTSGLGHRTAQQTDEFGVGGVEPTGPVMYYPGSPAGYQGGYYSYPPVNSLPYSGYENNYYSPYYTPQSVSDRKEEPGGSTKHGHDHGYGHAKYSRGGRGGGHSGQGSGLGASAMGLVSLIGLLSLLQTVLRALTTTTTTARTTGRKRRGATMMTEYGDEDGVPPNNDERGQKIQEISLMAMPALNLVAHARTGRIPLKCTKREICLLNQLLVKKLGVEEGRNVGFILSSAIIKLLKEVDYEYMNNTMDSISRAGIHGRFGEDCETVHIRADDDGQHCWKKLPLLMEPSHFAQFGLSPLHFSFP